MHVTYVVSYVSRSEPVPYFFLFVFSPTEEIFQKRFVRPFEDALPPPSFYHKDEVITKGLHDSDGYVGPCVFALAGNHDWIDGLETFTR